MKFSSIALVSCLAGFLGTQNASAALVTLTSTTVFEETFTASPNSSDMLVFFYNGGGSGGPSGGQAIVSLYDGAMLLGTYQYPTAPGFTVINTFFKAVGSPYVANPAAAVVNLGAMNSGTINGRLTVTLSSGSWTNFNTSAWVLEDANASGANAFAPHQNLHVSGTQVITPEPRYSFLLGLLAFAYPAARVGRRSLAGR
jgi:hypothetical protein